MGEAETEDVKDESTAYLDFLSQQAAKFSASVEGDEEEDVLEEESLLETPLDRMEPYGLFKRVFLGRCAFRRDDSSLDHIANPSPCRNEQPGSSLLHPPHQQSQCRRTAGTPSDGGAGRSI